ncbi:MAG: hypothetical protein ACK5PZ_21810 [Pirellula sp.]|jgi:hypothetical protein
MPRRIVFLGILVTALIGSFRMGSVIAQDSPKSGNRVEPDVAMVNQFIKQFEPAELSQETTEKIKGVFGKAAKEVVAKRKQSGVTPEMLKKRNEAVKQARDEGKKPKEVREIGLNALGGSEEQRKVVVETEELLAKARVEVGKLLTPEQKGKLPKQLQSNLKEPLPPKNPK